MILAFDRDQTIDVNEGPIPLGWVVELAKHVPTFAIGNPLLGREAGIPDHSTIKEACVNQGVTAQIFEPDWDQWKVIPEIQRPNIAGKFRRLSRLSALFPAEQSKVCIDDFPLYRMPGWTWWSPDGFYRMGFEYWLAASK